MGWGGREQASEKSSGLGIIKSLSTVLYSVAYET